MPERNVPKKLNGIKDTVTGVDLGVSSIAAVSDDSCILEELAPFNRRYAKKIRKLQQQMNRSKRKHNPQNYHADGTIKKGKKNWTYTKAYGRKRNLCKSVYRKKTAYTVQSHNLLADKILKQGRHIITEEMRFKALQKSSRSKLERSEKRMDVHGKTINKFKRKKRFGKSLNNRSPGRLKVILKQKAVLYGGSYFEVNTRLFKASQYNHVTDNYTKTPLNSRKKQIGSDIVQRDLYSAFLLKNTDDRFEHPDRVKCIDGFEHFIELQTKAIQEMRNNNISMKQCFGF